VSLVLQSFVSFDIYIVKKILTVWKLIGEKIARKIIATCHMKTVP